VAVVAERVTMRTVRKRLDARHVVKRDTPPLSHAPPSCLAHALELAGEGTDKGRSKDSQEYSLREVVAEGMCTHKD
jgi:hypothetical protein